MSEQVSSNISNLPFITSGKSYTKNSETYAQDAGRAIDLAFGTVLATILAEAGAVTADVGNTGDGTVTAFALASGDLPISGDWNLECIVATANGGTFKLEDPNGNIVANDLVLTAGAGAATTFITSGMTFVVTDGAADFIVGDKFALTITAVNKRTALDVTAVNGAGIPTAVYMGGTIATADIVAGDVVVYNVLVGGTLTLDSSQIVIEGSSTLDTVLGNGKTIRQTLYEIGVFAEDTDNIDYFEN